MLKIPTSRIAYVCVLGILIGFLVASLASDFKGQICEYNQATKYEDCAAYSLFPFVLIKVFKTLNDYGAAITAVATVAIGVFTLTLKLSTDKLWAPAKEQIAAAENAAKIQSADMNSSIAVAKYSADLVKQSIIASQRAWLTVEITLVKGQEGITISETGAMLPIRINMKNVGNVPTIKVSWHGWIVLAILNAFKEQSIRCSKIRQQPFGIGPTIFPQSQFPDPNIDWSFGAGASWEEINATLPRTADGEPRRVSGVALIGCVDYTFPADPTTHHQTGFVRWVSTLPFMIPGIIEKNWNVTVAVRSLVEPNLTFEAGAD